MSDMTGTKALYLEEYCRRSGRAYVRFDYFGHGASTGDFALGTIGRWRDDAVAVVDSLTEGKQILVGSSMSGWIMLLAALALAASSLAAARGKGTPAGDEQPGDRHAEEADREERRQEVGKEGR